jgi:hypothetical protein
MRRGRVTASEWNSRDVECQTCGKVLKASTLGRHLADVHDIYQQTVIAEELLEIRPPVLYTVDVHHHKQLQQQYRRQLEQQQLQQCRQYQR